MNYLQCHGLFFEGVREEPKRILLVEYLSEEPIKRKSRQRDHPQQQTSVSCISGILIINLGKLARREPAAIVKEARPENWNKKIREFIFHLVEIISHLTLGD